MIVQWKSRSKTFALMPSAHSCDVVRRGFCKSCLDRLTHFDNNHDVGEIRPQGGTPHVIRPNGQSSVWPKFKVTRHGDTFSSALR